MSPAERELANLFGRHPQCLEVGVVALTRWLKGLGDERQQLRSVDRIAASASSEFRTD